MKKFPKIRYPSDPETDGVLEGVEEVCKNIEADVSGVLRP